MKSVQSGQKSVFIVEADALYERMYRDRGWEVTHRMEESDLVQFTGGHDVSPELYGETKHFFTQNSQERDRREKALFNYCRKVGKPMTGICRGGQFLNVMCGGKMYQHVNNHAMRGTHPVVDTRTGKQYSCTSTHHQMMRPGDLAEILGVASESTVCEYMEGKRVRYVEQKRGDDIEVLFYPEQKALCFQPHPEYMEKSELCQEWYFELIEEKLFKENV